MPEQYVFSEHIPSRIGQHPLSNGLRFLGMTETVSNVSVWQPITLQNFNKTDCLGEALEFVYINDRVISFVKKVLNCLFYSTEHETKNNLL